MPENGRIIRTPETGCKYWNRKRKECDIKAKHRNLNLCKICSYGKQ